MTRFRSALLAVLALTLLAVPATDAAAKKKVALLRLQNGTTTIVADPNFTTALQGLSVAPTVLPPGEATTDGFAFPIVAGKLAGNKPAAGQIRHFGGLRLSTADGNHVDLNNLRINDGRKIAAVTTQIGSGARIVLAALDIENAVIKVTKRHLILGDIGLRLSEPAAAALDEQFATAAFAEGQLIGAATVDAKIRVKLKPRDP